jgi:hypothetical protein
MLMSKRIFHIADDVQRGGLIRVAMQKAVALAHECFFHAMMVDGLDDDALELFAHEAWAQLAGAYDFDYPRYARSLFVKAYKTAYRAAMRELPDARHPNTAELVAAFEAAIGLTPGSAAQSQVDEHIG